MRRQSMNEPREIPGLEQIVQGQETVDRALALTGLDDLLRRLEFKQLRRSEMGVADFVRVRMAARAMLGMQREGLFGSVDDLLRRPRVVDETENPPLGLAIVPSVQR